MTTVTALALLILGAAPTLPPPPAPASPAHRLCSHLVAGLLAEPGVLPATSVYRIDVTVAGGPESFGAYIADTLEGALNRTATGTTRERITPGRASHRLAVELTIRRARVDATARVVKLPTSVWEWLRIPDGVVLSTAISTAEMDLELRILAETPALGVNLKRLRLVEISKRTAHELLEAPVLDMLHADLDGDGLREVVLLQADRLLTARWRAPGQDRHAPLLDLIQETALTSLEPATSRLRQPIGRLVHITIADGTSAVLVASSERAKVSLWRYGRDRWHLIDASPGEGHWPLYSLGPGSWLTRGALSETGTLSGETIGLVEPDTAGYVQQALQPAHEMVYGVRAFPFFQASTPSWLPVLVSSMPNQSLTVWSPEDAQEPLVIAEAGDAAVVCDLDANGSPELLHTSSALEGADRLTLLELGGSRGGRSRWERAIAHPVTAMAAADLDEDGFQEVLIATWSGARAGMHLVTPVVAK
jgi:hypothetical protein